MLHFLWCFFGTGVKKLEVELADKEAKFHLYHDMKQLILVLPRKTLMYHVETSLFTMTWRPSLIWTRRFKNE